MADQEKEIKKEEKNETSALKERMQKVINASKKLDDDLTAEDPKKTAMKEKLAKASQEFEEENIEEIDAEKAEMSDEEILQKRKAEYYAKKNEEKQKQLAEMKAKLNAVMNETVGEEEQAIEEAPPVEEIAPVEEKTSEVVPEENVEELTLDEKPVKEETV